jgi:hypothetical protein
MKRLGGETLSSRTSADINQLPWLTSAKEDCSSTSMMEVLILDYAQAHSFKADAVQENQPKK